MNSVSVELEQVDYGGLSAECYVLACPVFVAWSGVSLLFGAAAHGAY